MPPGSSVPKQSPGATTQAVIRRHKVEMQFQRYPGTEASAAIEGLDYDVKIGSAPPRTGTLGADGKITLRLTAGQTAKVTILGTTYKVKHDAGLASKTTLKGVQRRLNMLGYNAGAVDGVMGPQTEYAVLNYQADNNTLRVDGLPSNKTQNSLETNVGE